MPFILALRSRRQVLRQTELPRRRRHIDVCGPGMTSQLPSFVRCADSRSRQIFAIAQYIAFFAAVANGLGKDAGILTPHQNTVWSDSLSASQILLLLSHALTKCSVVLLIRRLFARYYGIFRTISNVTLGLCMLWGVASVIAIVAGCSSQHLLAGTPSSICPHDVSRLSNHMELSNC